MKKPNIIMCDVDGVLADFTGAAYDAHGVARGSEIRLNVEWEIEKSIGITRSQFWKPLSSFEFWYNIPLMPGAKSFVDRLGQFAPVSFMTEPQPMPECAAAKVKYLHTHFGRGKHPIYLTIGPKCIFAKPELLLVDDRETTVKMWRKAGGRAVLFPQRWNNRRGEAEKQTNGARYKSVLEEVAAHF